MLYIVSVINPLFDLEGGLPKINFTKSIPKVSGEKAVFQCRAEITANIAGFDLFWLYYKWGDTVGEDITGRAEMKNSSSSRKRESVLKVAVDAKNGGTYKCIIQASVSGGIGFNFTRNANLTGKH